MADAARRLAASVLGRIERGGAYANLVLRAELDRSALDERDRAFVTDLVYGSTRMRRACDALVDRFVLTEPDPSLRTLLRLGAYQLHFARVAPHAAVGETVALAPKRSRGFVNAVLRKVASVPMVWPDDATRLSYPDWIVQRLVTELGRDDAMLSLERMNEPAPVHVRDDGYVQDPSSQWVADLVEAGPGMVVLDACAGPGGKATALAATGALVVGADRRAGRARLVQRNAATVGADMTVVVADAAAPPFVDAAFDRVLIDAPCSGLGALRRRADARWRIGESDITQLADLQQSMLTAAGRLVRPGGLLVYSVCTLTAAESIDHQPPDGFVPVAEQPGAPWRPYGDGVRILPHDADTDGMVVLRYRRLP